MQHTQGSPARPALPEWRERPYLIAATQLERHAIMAAESCKSRHPWFKYREIHDALACLSDRDLADIGVKRGEIPLIARRGAGIAPDFAVQGE